MEKVKIQRVKRNKKKLTTKEKVLAGLGLGTTILGGGVAMGAPKSGKTAFVSTQKQDQGKSASSKIKTALNDIFGVAPAKADEGDVYGTNPYTGEQYFIGHAGSPAAQAAIDSGEATSVTDATPQTPPPATSELPAVKVDPSVSPAVEAGNNGNAFSTGEYRDANPQTYAAGSTSTADVVTPQATQTPPLVNPLDPSAASLGSGAQGPTTYGARTVRTASGTGSADYQEGDTKTEGGINYTYYQGAWVINNGQTKTDGGFQYGSNGNQWILLDGQTKTDGGFQYGSGGGNWILLDGQTKTENGHSFHSSGGVWVDDGSVAQAPSEGETRRNDDGSTSTYYQGNWVLNDGQTKTGDDGFKYGSLSGNWILLDGQTKTDNGTDYISSGGSWVVKPVGMAVPREGDMNTGADGYTYVFTNQHWQLQDGQTKVENNHNWHTAGGVWVDDGAHITTSQEGDTKTEGGINYTFYQGRWVVNNGQTTTVNGYRYGSNGGNWILLDGQTETQGGYNYGSLGGKWILLDGQAKTENGVDYVSSGGNWVVKSTAAPKEGDVRVSPTSGGGSIHQTYVHGSWTDTPQEGDTDGAGHVYHNGAWGAPVNTQNRVDTTGGRSVHQTSNDGGKTWTDSPQEGDADGKGGTYHNGQWVPKATTPVPGTPITGQAGQYFTAGLGDSDPGLLPAYRAASQPYTATPFTYKDADGNSVTGVTIATKDASGKAVTQTFQNATEVYQFLSSNGANFSNLSPSDQAIYTALNDARLRTPGITSYAATTGYIVPPPSNATVFSTSGNTVHVGLSSTDLATMDQANYLAKMFPGATVVQGSYVDGVFFQNDYSADPTRQEYALKLPNGQTLMVGPVLQEFTEFGLSGLQNEPGFSMSAGLNLLASNPVIGAKTGSAPSLTFTNLTRPQDSGNFGPNDVWQITVTNGAPNTPVYASGGIYGKTGGKILLGTTDADGNFSKTLDRGFTGSEAGNWQVAILVGSAQVGNTLNFSVAPGGTGTANGVTATGANGGTVIAGPTSGNVATSLTFKNLTSGNTQTLKVGDQWQITVTGPEGATVYVTGGKNGGTATTPMGTIQNGSLTLSGTISPADIGTWDETWKVGSSPATATTIGSFSFTAVAASTSNPTVVASPVINSLSSSSVVPGGSLTINGSNFDSAAAGNIVEFITNGVATQATVTSASATSLTVTVPSTLQVGTTYSVRVRNASDATKVSNTFSVLVATSGQIAASNNSNVQVVPASLTALSKSTAAQGETVTVTGANFNPVFTNNLIVFRNSSNQVVGNAAPTAGSATSLTFTVPASLPAGSYQVSVNTSTVLSQPSTNSLPLVVTVNTAVSPTLSFTNTNGSGTFRVGDTWKLQIANAQPGADVFALGGEKVNGVVPADKVKIGVTDANGNFVLTKQLIAADQGDWQISIMVGTTAVGNPLVFSVLGADVSTSGVTLTLSASTATLQVGQKTPIASIISAPSGVSTALTASSSNAAVATVLVDGTGNIVITGVSAGTATVTVHPSGMGTDTSQDKTIAITVTAVSQTAAVTVTLSASAVSVQPGQSSKVTTIISAPSGVSTAITAISSNTAVATASVDSTGNITITGVSAGTATVTVHPSGMGTNTSQDKIITVTVNSSISAPVLNGGMLSSGTVGIRYVAAIAVQSGTGSGTITYSVASGSLPPGLSLNLNGSIDAVPQVAGTYTFTVQATDSQGRTVTAQYTMTVNPPAYNAGSGYVYQGGSSGYYGYNPAYPGNGQVAGASTFRGLQMPPGYPASGGLQMQNVIDASGRYANVQGTIYDKTTSHAFATPQEFFSASGYGSFDGLLFDTNWRPGSAVLGATTGTTYTVKKGDTLWAISKKYYGDGKQWRKIMAANASKIKSTKTLKIGTQLIIP